MKNNQSEKLRELPSVHAMVADLMARPFISEKYHVQTVTWAARKVLDKARISLTKQYSSNNTEERSGQEEFWEYPLEMFSEKLANWLEKEILQELRGSASSLIRIINATGVVLHTNCGRALLAPEVAQYVAEQAMVYSNLEIDVKTGNRGSRYHHVHDLLVELTGAEAALIVNNNAAAVLLIMNTFANQKEVIVSRGELVEVGGSFRIPEVLKAGGARLCEVGATNKTHLRDYQEAISAETAMLLKVHPSNYRIEGFHQTVPLEELVKLGRDKDILVVEDLGSGSFIDGIEYGLPEEPTIPKAVKTGASLVTFSGDKLLGGPQAGIIVGQKELIAKLKENHLLRALRVDKLTLSALAGTLQLYQRGDIGKIPVWQMLAKTSKELQREAQNIYDLLANNPHIKVEIQQNYSCVGGGAFPTAFLPTFVCAITSKRKSSAELEAFLRSGNIPILARIEKDKILIDPRTLLPEDVKVIEQRLGELEMECMITKIE